MKGHLRFVCPAALLCVWVSSTSTAQAQIYALREQDGTLVLSDKPLGPGARTFAVQGSGGTIRTTSSSDLSTVATATRVSRWDSTIEEHAAAQRVRPELVRAVIQVESAYNPRARSHKGAMGLMQLMPGTAADLGVVNPYDPEQNIRGGVAYLRMLLDKFGGNEELALAAYNAGPGAVSRYGDNIPPYRETQQYVDKVRSRTSVVGATNSTIYKIFKVVDGREVVFYSGTKPPRGSKYEIVVRQRAVTMPVADDGSEMR
jgi:soluble lytic murein transglycosylase-like protein